MCANAQIKKALTENPQYQWKKIVFFVRIEHQKQQKSNLDVSSVKTYALSAYTVHIPKSRHIP